MKSNTFKIKQWTAIIECNDLTLITPTVSVGNIRRFAMDILLTTLHSKNKLIKIGFINERNIISRVGNTGIVPKQKQICQLKYICINNVI